MTRLYTGSAAALVSALLGATAYYVLLAPRADDPYAECRTSVVSGGPETIGGPFTLVDQTGATVTNTEVIAKPALIYFGYASCTDVCPLDNVRNAEAADILEEQGYEVTPVFISVDPGRDTPTVMADYVSRMHPRMIGLTGTEAQVKTATSAYRVFAKLDPAEGKDYPVDHSTFTYLVLPDKGFVEFFRREATADEVAGKVGCFLQNT